MTSTQKPSCDEIPAYSSASSLQQICTSPRVTRRRGALWPQKNGPLKAETFGKALVQLDRLVVYVQVGCIREPKP